ncbi:bifunctional metallophosphatase/5'-nucleotidase [bacterium]|nr:bifunctional metallophosphatase/5'-nucleotidase [bacterium]UNM09929.1 MAG: bifunctional metallophosphatase/5'-nucleotidase [Planctomycetales bacterium]
MRRSFLMTVLLMVSAILLLSAPALAEELNLGIVSSNDSHGHIMPFSLNGEPGWGGMARRRVAIQTARADTDYYWMVLDAGDVFQGTPISNMLTGFLDIECMNQMGYDAMCLGNHEFDFGYDLIRGRMPDANFPMLSCNVIDKERGTSVGEPYHIFRRGDYRIGVIGLTTQTLLGETNPRVADYVDVYDPVPIVRSLAQYLRSIGVDIVIAVGHQGYGRDQAMAEAIPELDVIVGGHTHTKLDEPDRVGDVVITQSWEWGKQIGVLKLNFERDSEDERFRLASYENEYVPMSPDKPEDDGMKAFIADYDQRFSKEMDRFVCTALQDFPVDEVRIRENALADMIADSMRQATEADVAYFNGGNFRAGLEAGEVNFGDLYGVLPYDNFLMKVPMPGWKLIEILEHAGLQYGDGGFPQVSGLRLRYEDMNLVSAQVLRGGEYVDIDPNEQYLFLTTDFMAIGGDGFPMDEDPYGPGYTGMEQRSTFAQWASQQRELSWQTDGRVVFDWVNMEDPGIAD